MGSKLLMIIDIQKELTNYIDNNLIIDILYICLIRKRTEQHFSLS